MMGNDGLDDLGQCIGIANIGGVGVAPSSARGSSLVEVLAVRRPVRAGDLTKATW
jgi:hypothetical protein